MTVAVTTNNEKCLFTKEHNKGKRRYDIMRKVFGMALVLMSMAMVASAVPPTPVPDAGGSTVALLGMGLSGLALIRQKFMS